MTRKITVAAALAAALLAAFIWLSLRDDPMQSETPTPLEGGVSVGDPKSRGMNDQNRTSQAERFAPADGAYVHESRFSAESATNPDRIDREERAREKLRELTGSSSVPYGGGGPKMPQEVIDILVEGMDDLTAAKHLLHGFVLYSDWSWRSEPEYAAEYADRVLAKDPTSRDALLVKLDAGGASYLDARRRIMELYPDDPDMMVRATNGMVRNYPEEVVAALERLLPEEGPHSNMELHENLGISYERLDMLDVAALHYLLAIGFDESHFGKEVFAPPKELRNPHGHGVRDAYVVRYMSLMFRGERNYPSIWEERRQGAPSAEMDMAAAYADLAKAYQSAFEMEYGLSEATPEGYMNALLGMARAFARAGDAKRGQDAYNAVRKRHSREEVQQAFRQMDERERLRRQASNEEDDDEDE